MSASYRCVNNILQKLGFNLSRGPGFGMSDMLGRMKQHSLAVSSILDIGASDGKWSEEAMHHFQEARFLGIDPLAEREEYLKRLSLNHPQFDYVIAAAGDVDEGYASMRVDEGDLDSSTINGTNPGDVREVPLRSIDSLVKEFALPAPYFLKFDTHGYEVPIIKGADRTLEETNAVLMEVHNFHIAENALRFPQMCTFMEERGFLPLDIGGLLLREYDAAFWQMDILFARKQLAAFRHNQFR